MASLDGERLGRISRQLTSVCIMMVKWIFLFVLVATDYVGATDDDDCSKDTTEACDLGDVTRYITKMVSERNSINCKIVLESLECVVRVEEKCHFDDDFLDFAKQSLPVIQDRCRRVLPELPLIDAEEEEGECSSPTAIACKMSDLANLEGGLYDRCRTLLEKAECMIRVEEKCHFDKYVLEMAKNQLPSLKRVCGKEKDDGVSTFVSFRGNILGASMHCIRNVLNDETTGYCSSSPCKFKLIKYAEALIEKGIISDVDINILTCLGRLNSFTCLAFNVEKKCGHFAFGQYMKIMKSMPENIMTACGGLEFKDVFPTMLEVYKENEQAEKLLRRVFKTSGM